jgi:hypothetical protein
MYGTERANELLNSDRKAEIFNEYKRTVAKSLGALNPREPRLKLQGTNVVIR